MLRIIVLSAFWLSFVVAPGAAAPTNASKSATVLLSTGDSQLRQGQYADALRSYQEALARFQQLSDHRGESKALVGIGLAQMNQHQYADALQAEQQALALLQQQDDPNEEATALSIIGVVEGVHLFHFALGEQSLERALAIYRQLGDRQGEATTLNSIGNFQDDQDQFADALQSYAQAFVLLQDLDDRTSAAKVEQSIATEQSIVSRLSNPATQSLPKHELDANASALLSDGDRQYQEGRDADALHSYQDALAAFERFRDPEGQAKALMSIAIVQGKTQYADALRAEEQAVTLFRQQGDLAGEASTLNNMGAAEGIHGQYALALESFEQAFALYWQLGNRVDEAAALDNIGITEATHGRHAIALQSFEEALVLSRQLGDRNEEAQTLLNIGKLQTSQGQLSDALQSYQRSLSLFQQVGDQANAASAEHLIEQVRSLMSAPSPSPQPTRPGVAVEPQPPIGAPGAMQQSGL
jgi:tetratricopeptide (TPR) repeat protein